MYFAQVSILMQGAGICLLTRCNRTRQVLTPSTVAAYPRNSLSTSDGGVCSGDCGTVLKYGMKDSHNKSPANMEPSNSAAANAKKSRAPLRYPPIHRQMRMFGFCQALTEPAMGQCVHHHAPSTNWHVCLVSAWYMVTYWHSTFGGLTVKFPCDCQDLLSSGSRTRQNAHCMHTREAQYTCLANLVVTCIYVATPDKAASLRTNRL